MLVILMKGGKLVLKRKLHITMGAMLATLKWYLTLAASCGADYAGRTSCIGGIQT